ncbi:MAG: hypothetical protein KAR39_04605 [Thermoplasmata archaeon]|nr:hypothetical protein [Thermoplasmata archaeon]
MKMAKILKTDGKWSVRKIVAALMVPLMMFIISTWYGRYSWIRDQAYKVAVNEKYIVEAKENLQKKDKELQKAIDDLKAEMNKKSGILHSRANKETDKREKGDERLLNLILDMLDNQQRNIQHQQDRLEKKAK